MLRIKKNRMGFKYLRLSCISIKEEDLGLHHKGWSVSVTKGAKVI
jgi:hypothetical protein